MSKSHAREIAREAIEFYFNGTTARLKKEP